MKRKANQKVSRQEAGARIERAAEDLHSLAIRLLRRVRVADPQTGLSPSRLSALSVVVYAGPLTLGELAHLEQVSPPTITRLVHGLVAEDLVTLEVNPHDRRSRLVASTSHGRRVLEQGRRRRAALLREDLARLSTGELAAVVRATQALRSLFD